MFCRKCGNELAPGAKFCPVCGNAAAAAPAQQPVSVQACEFVSAPVPQQPKLRQSKAGWIAAAIEAVILIILLVVFLPLNRSEALSAVQDGHFSSYPDVSVGSAFSDFFAHPAWDSMQTSSDTGYVMFTGECFYNGKPVEAEFLFSVDLTNGSFEVEQCLLGNDIKQVLSHTDIILLLEVIYD